MDFQMYLDVKQVLLKGILEAFHASCPQLKRWQEAIQYQLKSNRTLVTPLGRKKFSW